MGSGMKGFRGATAWGWLRELVLGLLEAFTASEQGVKIATVVEIGNPGLPKPTFLVSIMLSIPACEVMQWKDGRAK